MSSSPAGQRGNPPPGRPALPRAVWHRRAALVPVSYLAAAIVAAAAHAELPQARWLLIHLLLLGAVTNAIVVWSTHFAAAILRAPAPRSRQGEAARLAALNLGVIAVLTGATGGWPWLGVAGAGVVFAAVAAHLCVLSAHLRRALPARFAVTIHYYLAASAALLTGIPAGAWMLLLPDDQRPRLLLFHAHVNVLGWVALTVLGTLVTLWPTVLRTRMADGAVSAARRGLPLGVAGLAAVSAGVLAWWPAAAAAGLVLFAAAVLIVMVPAAAAARQRPPASFAAWSIGAGMGWLLACLGWDAWMLLQAGSAAVAAGRMDTIALALAAGFAAQVLLGALSYLLPMALGGGPVLVRRHTAALDRYWAQRVTTANLALVAFLSPAPAWVRISAGMLLAAAVALFLIPAVHLLASRRPE